jgi:Ca-activated chloride channel family protein
MNLLAPLSLLFGFAMAPVIVMYFLKRKRRKVRVPSTYLWLKSVEDMRVNAPFQRLRTSLLLFLQLLLIAVATLALARPLFHEPAGTGKKLVILIDRSASMAMTDVKPSRMDSAKESARAAIGALADGDEAMIIAFSSQAEVVSPFTTDRAAAARALEPIRPASTATSIREAFQMAVAAARQRPGSEILVLSDGNFDAVAAHPDDVQVRYVPIGGEPVNAAITGLDVRRPDAPGDPWTVFAYVDHYSKAAREITLELYVNAKLREVKPVALEPERGRAAIFETHGDPPEFVEVRIGTEDHLSLDDRAWHVVSADRKRALVVTLGNFFLEQAVAQYPRLVVERAQPGAVSAADAAGYDVGIFDGHAPPGLGQGRYLFVNCLPDWEGFRDEGAIQAPMAVDWDRQHPVTRLIEFSHLAARSARKVAAPAYVKTLVESAQGAMISAWIKAESRAVAVNFDVLQSDWPLRLSFPLFVGNAIEWLTREGSGEWQAHRMPGDPLRFRLPEGLSKAEVMTPRGDRHSVVLEPGAEEVVFTRTDEVGIYVVKFEGGTERLYAVNLMNPQESSGRVIPELRFGDETVKGQAAPPPPPKEYWHWLAWLALALLCLEWMVFHRRI